MPRFVSTAYPALSIRMGDKKFKFVGGKLDVTEDDADLIREFARVRDLYKITEVAERDEQPAEAEGDEGAAGAVTTFTHDADKDKAPEDPNGPPVAVGPIPPEAVQEPDEDAQKPDVLPDAPSDAADASADPADDVEDDTEAANANVHAEAEEQPNAAPLDDDPADMDGAQLNAALKEKGLSTRGNKAERLARLQEAE